MIRPTITISPEFKQQLSKEFNTSQTTVQLSLHYVNNSELAKGIRKRAVELLKAEASKAEQLEQENRETLIKEYQSKNQ